ncbi:gliding motility-associated peptidyl-prolyl isomerase GldI [Tenacibaculum jejuense]|nr:gliding motility-associated peptidyl-prolyl isomerase GldI [Tenacibaculum jejuense]
MNSKCIFILALVVLVGACNSPEARRPVKHTTSNFYKEVIEENIKLNQLEKKQIENSLAKDTLNNYLSSPSGFWYTYNKKDSLSTITPKKGDVVTIQYSITDFYNSPIYEEQKIEYKVDKEDFIPALQEGIKLMKKGETITFVIPSYRAYGVTGDGNKIRMNQTLKSKLTLIDIKKVNNEIN